MWITEKKLKEFMQSEMQAYLQRSGTNLESAVAAIKDCFKVDNNGKIDVTNSNFNLYIDSTVTKTADERQLAEIKDLVSGLYGVLAEKSAEELRRFGFFEEALDRTDAALEQMRTDLKKNAERTAEELEQLRADLLDGVHSVLECQERLLQDVKKELTDAFTEQKREILLNARANLYGIMNEIWAGRYDQTYPERICHWSNEIKRQLPEDFIADFCLTVFAPSENVALECRFLSGKCAGRTEEERAFVLRTMLHRLRQKRLMLPINVWLEEYKNACADQNDPVYLSFKKAYDVRKQELDDGVYQVSKPRKVFVAFSRKDIDVVLPMVDELEERNITCFVSTRNMLQENGDHYEEDLKKAIEACDVFLLVSTRNSRADDCDAYRIEMMKLLYDSELKAYRRTHGRNCRYEEIPASFKKKRLEYLVEAYRTPMTYEEEDVKKLIFYGQDPCNKDTLTSAIRAKLLEVLSDDEPVLDSGTVPAPAAEPPAPAEPQASAVKYCGACGTECAGTIKFCPNCGGKRFRPTKDAKYCVGCDAEMLSSVKFCTECGAHVFAATPEDAAEQRQKLAEEAEERRKAEEEAKRKAEKEAKRKAEAEARRKAEEVLKRRKAIATDLREKGTFGSYPQTRVTDKDLIRRLNWIAGNLPTTKNAAGWTSYKYYVEGKNDRDFMWYVDVSEGGERYRGVYFTSYRPCYTRGSSSESNSYQDDNGYTTGNVYWFRYEPIKWRILSESNGEALIFCEMIIDSQEYCHYTTDSQFEHNGGTGYANNYALSNIRAWLNDTFYNTAFSDVQKQIILLTTVDNSARSTYPNGDATQWDSSNNSYVCENTEDYVFLLSEQEVTNTAYGFNADYDNYDTARQKKNTDYAKSQGVWTSSDSSYAGNGVWWLRSPYFDYSNYALGVGGGYGTYGIVYSTLNGVVPALKIKLS